MKKIILGLLILVSFLYDLTFAHHIPINSDASSIVLQAQSILKGDFYLSSWNLSTGSYILDVLLYAIGVLIFGISPKVIYVMSALSFILVIIISITIAGKENNYFSYRKSFITLGIIEIPSLFFGSIAFSGPMHLFSLFFVLTSLLILQYDGHPIFRYSIFTLLLALVSISDNFMFFVFTIPIFLTYVIQWMRNQEKNSRWILGCIVIAIFLSKIPLYHLSKSSNVSFIPLNQFPFHFSLEINGLLQMYDAYFFGRTLSGITIKVILFHAFILGIFLFLIFRYILKEYSKLPTLSIFLLLAISINGIEYLLSDMAVDINSTRYLFPMFFYLAVFIGKYGFEQFSITRNRLFVMFTFVILSASFISPSVFLRKDQINKTIVEFMKTHHLKQGYGSYWNASNLTVLSHGSIKISPVFWNGTKVAPYRWLSNNQWYNQTANFIILPKVKSNPSLNQIYQTFGKPKKIYDINNRIILVWKKNIQPNLSQ